MFTQITLISEFENCKGKSLGYIITLRIHYNSSSKRAITISFFHWLLSLLCPNVDCSTFVYFVSKDQRLMVSEEQQQFSFVLLHYNFILPTPLPFFPVPLKTTQNAALKTKNVTSKELHLFGTGDSSCPCADCLLLVIIRLVLHVLVNIGSFWFFTVPAENTVEEL